MRERVPRQIPARLRPDTGNQCPSPWEADRLRRLSRSQVADRIEELGALYAAHSGSAACEEEWRTRTFVRRLVADTRRPGFSLVVAENGSLTACAYGFPLRDGLFEVRAIVVPRRVREQSTSRDWNLARRLQRRLLVDEGHATGLTLVDRTELRTLAALRSWGWKDTPASPHGARLPDPRHVLLLAL
ncbi:hypothetical protein V2W30_21320 [Streptomyces sp. Q6]|uniref:Uncharacterized protein n=1 Tax=Streptomyces citrinus TaxID=3118173 RepID=A0ACD5AEI3_9ACTN